MATESTRGLDSRIPESFYIPASWESPVLNCSACVFCITVVHVWHSSIQNEPRPSLQDKEEESTLPETSWSIHASGAVASQHQQGKSHSPLHSEHHLPFQLTFAAISPYSLCSGKVLTSLRRANGLPLNYCKSRRDCFTTQINSHVLRVKDINITQSPSHLLVLLHTSLISLVPGRFTGV